MQPADGPTCRMTAGREHRTLDLFQDITAYLGPTCVDFHPRLAAASSKRLDLELVKMGIAADRILGKPVCGHRNGTPSDYVHVHDDAPIERTRNGAYVMTWLWVPNEQAGFPRLHDFDDYDASEECLERLEATQRFDVEALDVEAEQLLGSGTVDEYHWQLFLEAGLLTFIVQRYPQSLAWLHAETSREGADKDLEDEPTEERCLRFMLEAISKFRELHSM